MNPVLVELAHADRPETPCTVCTHAIWYTGSPQTEKTALAAFCAVLGQQVYSSEGDGRAVQECAAMELDD